MHRAKETGKTTQDNKMRISTGVGITEKSIFSDHNGMRWKNQQKENWKIPKYVEIKPHTQTTDRSKKKSKGKLENILWQVKMKMQHTKPNGVLRKSHQEGNL